MTTATKTNIPTELLQAGDVLSYSAGSTQVGPQGFRKLRKHGGLLAATLNRWPDLKTFFAGNTPLFINAYPASLGTFQGGVAVDTYLSPRVLSRALQLGRLHELPTIIVGQPLFLVDALQHHLDAQRPLPRNLMLWTGGYAMPRSLERRLRSLLTPQVARLEILQYFGAAEVDAACLMCRELSPTGQPIYLPRNDVVVELEDDRLLLSLLAADGSPIIERFATGDRARPFADGWLIDNPQRLHPDIAAEFESWSDTDWARRTGYLWRVEGALRLQVRPGVVAHGPAELEHFEFARRFGFSWLDKPIWS